MCENCTRKAKYTYPVAGENPAVKCGYHTWWFGTLGDSEYHEQLKKEYKIEDGN